MSYKPRRPLGVTFLALAFLWIGFVGTIIFPLIAFTTPWHQLGISLFGARLASAGWFRTISAILGWFWFFAYIAYAVIGFGLWKLKNWARKSVLVITALCIVGSVLCAINFVRPFSMSIAVVGIALFYCGWMAYYLLRPRVLYAFGAWNGYGSDGQWIEPPGLPKRAKIGIAVLLPISMIVLFAIPLLFAVDSMMRQSQPYKLAMNAAEASPCVANSVGLPLKSGGMVSGSTEESSQTGSAYLEIPVKGPKGKGSLAVEAKKSNGNWKIDSLVLSRGAIRSNLISADGGRGCQ
jgi:hypothetical protein